MSILIQRFVLEERSPFARSCHMRRQQISTGEKYDNYPDDKALSLPPKLKLPDQNLTVQQLFQRYPGKLEELYFSSDKLQYRTIT